MENRHGLLVDACLTLADGHAERVAALHMIEPRAERPQAITLGADKATACGGASFDACIRIGRRAQSTFGFFGILG